MQDALTLFNAVLPDEGYYGYCLIGERTIRGFDTTKEALAQRMLAIDAQGHYTPYFVTVSFKDSTRKQKRHTQDNIHSVQEFQIDIDIRDNDKHYRTAPDALAGLSAALRRLDWPRPFLVFSGHGFHAHWALEKPLTPEEHRVYARAFQQMLSAANPDAPSDWFDAKGTVHPSHVLRVPGTIHRGKWQAQPNAPDGSLMPAIWHAQEPSPVRLLAAGQRSPLDAFRLKVEPSQARMAKARSTGLRVDLLDEFPLAPAELVLPKCRQLAAAFQPGQHLPEPFFLTCMSVLKRIVNGYAYATHLAGLDIEGRNQGRLNKWDRANEAAGYNCEAFRACNPGGCEGCPKREEFITPLQWASVAPVEPQEPADPPPAPEGMFNPIGEKWAGGYFSEHGDGGLAFFPFGEQEHKIIVSEYPIFIVGERRREFGGEHSLVIAQEVRGELKEYELDYGVVLGPGAQGHLAKRGVKTVASEGVRQFINLAINRSPAAKQTYDRFGWVEDDTGFVIGRRLIRKDSVEDIIPSEALKSYADKCQPVGRLDKWLEGLACFNPYKFGAERYPHAFVLGAGFGGSLLKFRLPEANGGVIINSHAQRPNVGKSTCSYYAVSGQGNAVTLTLSPTATPTGRTGHMVKLRHVPCGGDEFLGQRHPDEVKRELIVWTTGRPMTVATDVKVGSSDQRPGDWCGVMLASANKSAASFLADDPSAQGQLCRVIDLEFLNEPIKGDRALSGLYADNYGLAAQPWYQHILRIGIPTIVQRLDAYEGELRAKYPELDPRFQAPVLAAVQLALEELGPQGLGWITDWREHRANVLEYAAQAVAGQRRVQLGEGLPIDVLTRFLRKHARHIYGLQSSSPADFTREYVMGRVDEGQNLVILDQAALKRGVSESNYSYRSFLNNLELQGVVRSSLARVVMLAGTPLECSSVPAPCVVFNLDALRKLGAAMPTI